MQCIFECDLDQQSTKYIVCYLTGDVMNVYEYCRHVTYMDAVLSAETDALQRQEYLKKNGDPYLFELPYMHKFHSGVPIFLKTPEQWMKQVTQIKWFSHYK